MIEVHDTPFRTASGANALRDATRTSFSFCKEEGFCRLGRRQNPKVFLLLYKFDTGLNPTTMRSMFGAPLAEPDGIHSMMLLVPAFRGNWVVIYPGVPQPPPGSV